MRGPADDIDDVTFARADWVGEEEEAAIGRPFAELGRLARRARQRWGRTLLLAVVATGVVVGLAARSERVYSSRIAFRVQEGALEADAAPKTPHQLREYVSQLAFLDAHLVAVMKEEGVYASLLDRDPTRAVQAMRDDIEIDAWRNDYGRRTSTERASTPARVSVVYRGRDREKVFAVAQHLGRLIREQEQSTRLHQSDAALRLIEEQLEVARRQVQQHRSELAEKGLRQRTARTPTEALRLIEEARTLERAISRGELIVQAGEVQRERAYLRRQLARRALGMSWELTDGGRIEPLGTDRWTLLGILAAVLFLVSLPLAAVVVGASDPHVYDPADVKRLGLTVVGAVRPFNGDNAGALETRLNPDDRRRDDEQDQYPDGWAW